MKELLSNPALDELYAIRRVFVNQYSAHLRVKDQLGSVGVNYYANKVQAMDVAIAAFIEVHKVPDEHIEHSLAGFAKHGYNAVKEALGIPHEANSNGTDKSKP